jgi:hypothetical protein
VLPFLAPALLIGYTFLSFTFDPFLKGWTAQNLILSPPVTDYLLAFGVVLPFAIASGVKFLGSANSSGLFLVGWLILLPFLTYAPYNLQRRLPEGIWVALVILAILKIDTVRLAVRRTAWIFLSTGVLGSVMLLVGSLGVTTQPVFPIFRPAGEVEMFNFLAKTAALDDVVLASFNTSNALPAWAPVRTVTGHGPESVNLSQLTPRIARFYSGDKVEQTALAAEFHIRFVIYGPAEKALGAWDPAGQVQFELVYDQNGYQVFEMRNN